MHKNWQIFVCALALAVSGCVSSRVQQGGMPGAVHSATAIYVAPFHNATGNSAAGDAVSELVTTSLLSQNLPVVQSEATLQRGRELVNGAEGTRDILGLARAAYASHAVVGTVHEYRFNSDLDGAPTAGLTMRLVDVASGETLWQGSSSAASGYYGSLSRTAQTAVNKLVRKMTAGRGRAMPRDEGPVYQASTPSPYYPETPSYQETRRTVSTSAPQPQVTQRSYVTEQEASAAWAAPVNGPPPSRYDPVGYDVPPAFYRSSTHQDGPVANTVPRYARASARDRSDSAVRGPVYHAQPVRSARSRRSEEDKVPVYTEQIARRGGAAAQEAPPWAYDPPPQTISDPVYR
jgi:TolB-like protein